MQNLRDRFKMDFKSRISLVCGIFGLLSIWLVVNNTDPAVTIPHPVMPKPNAHDFYVAAGSAMKDGKQIVDAVSRKPSRTYSAAQKAAFVRQNAGVLVNVQAGFAYPYLNPPIRSWNADTEYYTRFRQLVCLFTLKGELRAGHGDWSGAAESYLDGLRFGEDIQKGSPLLGHLAGSTYRNIARRRIWAVVEHLNVAQTQAVITRLTGIQERHVPFVDMIQEEKWVGQAARSDFLRDTGKSYPTLSSKDSHGQTIPDLSMYYLYRSKRRIMDDFTTYMDRSAQIAQQPYSMHKPAPPLPTDILNAALTIPVLQYRIKDVESETQNGLLLVSLALHSFRLEQGHCPKTLAELVPTYLKKLPEDPFARGGTFRYHSLGSRYLLYSVGPDGSDDNGTPIDDPSKMMTPHPETRYDVLENSVGDVIAGINLQ